MSNRGFLVTNPGSPGWKFLAESKSYIPLFWPAFLSRADVEAVGGTGGFALDRRRAIERGTDRLAFLSSLFPQVPAFPAAVGALLHKLGSLGCETIGMELSQLLDDGFDPAMPGLAAAVGAIEDRNPDYSVTVLERTVMSPFHPGTTVRLQEQHIRTTQELLLQVCRVNADFLTSENVRDAIIGYVWEWPPAGELVPAAPPKRPWWRFWG
jgi:hypothetical protein